MVYSHYSCLYFHSTTHSPIYTVVMFQKIWCKSNFVNSGLIVHVANCICRYNWAQVNLNSIALGPGQMQHSHSTTFAITHPAVFCCHLQLIVLSLQQGKIWHAFQKLLMLQFCLLVLSFVSLKMNSFKLRKLGSVCNSSKLPSRLWPTL